MVPVETKVQYPCRDNIQTVLKRKYDDCSVRADGYKILLDKLADLNEAEEKAVYALLNDHLQIWRVER